MQLNLKDPETNMMVARLSQVTGVSKARAVKDAVRARLADVDAAREADIVARIARVRELTAQIRARLPDPMPTQKQFDDWLYDENGLPR